MKIEAIKHADVLGKEQLYAKITNSKGKTHVINIGEKTFKALQELITDEETKPLK